MEVVKKTTITPMTTDGKVIEEGQTVVFGADGKCLAGVFKGITKRGSLCFGSLILSNEFCVMPNSISKILIADIDVNPGVFPMNPPVED